MWGPAASSDKTRTATAIGNHRAGPKTLVLSGQPRHTPNGLAQHTCIVTVAQAQEFIVHGTFGGDVRECMHDALGGKSRKGSWLHMPPVQTKEKDHSSAFKAINIFPCSPFTHTSPPLQAFSPLALAIWQFPFQRGAKLVSSIDLASPITHHRHCHCRQQPALSIF
jgi:hypothetical protein